jgi:hypothetical protein
MAEKLENIQWFNRIRLESKKYQGILALKKETT